MKLFTRRLRAWLQKIGPARRSGIASARRPLQIEHLEGRALPATTYHLDLGLSGSPVGDGYAGMGVQPYSVAKGYGWKSTSGIAAIDRLTSNPLTRDFHRGTNGMFYIDVPNGVYNVTATLGDPTKLHDQIEVRAEAQVLATGVTTQIGETWTKTYQVAVSDGQLTLRVVDRGGSDRHFALSEVVVTPHTGPVANAGVDKTANEGASVSFTGSASGNGPLSYHWDFGDGGTADGTLTPQHTFADNGQYNVTLTVTDVDGMKSSDIALATVSNVAPTPSHGGSYSGNPGANITFNGSASDPSSTDTTAGFTWAWTFGDGGTSTQRVPTHAYAAAGAYTVTFSATDKDGAKTTVSTTATVSSAGSDDWIVTPHDKVPNYGKNPTIVSVASGAWSNTATWSLGRLPQAGDVVAVMPSTVVTYDVSSTAKLYTVVIRPEGELTFRTDVSTKMVVANLLVLERGALTIGTAANPVAAGVTAEVHIASQALNTAFDPEQYGTGLLGWGRVTMHGATRSASFARLAAEPKAGQTTLSLAEAVTGWRPGEKVFLPDTRQLRDFERGANYMPRWEESVIQSISADGKTITLTAGLKFDHPGARNADGVLEFLPHVGVLTRNVLVRSESAIGTRGHVLFMDRAEVDVRYVQFGGLGRTTNGEFDDTTFYSDGTVNHVGTNQSGRYPVQFGHLAGPVTPPANGYQYTFVGNSVTCPLNPMPFRWGIVINDSHYGLVKENVLYNWAGAGLVTENGNESFNVIERNFVARVTGTGNRLHEGREGLGFWFRGPNNYVRNNVAASIGGDGGSGASSYGFNYFMYYLGNVTLPTKPGDYTHDGGTTVDGNGMPIREFIGNEVYGATAGGLTFWHIGTFGDWPNDKITADSVFKDVRIWHHYDFGVFGYPGDRVVIDGLQIRGDPAVVSNPYEMVTGVTFSDYPMRNLTIKNVNIQGMQIGIEMPYVAPGVTNVRDSYLRNVTDMVFTTMYSVNGSANLPARKSVLTNVRFAGLPGLSHLAIDMKYDAGHGNNLIQKDEVFLYDYNGTPGLNYRLYYEEQKASFVVPKSSGNLIGSPEASLTNQQNWTKYGIAIGGAIAPSNASKISGIDGLVVLI